MSDLDKAISLVKALEAGNYNAMPSSLVQGAALQVENLENVIHNVTFEDKALILQKMIKTTPCKSNLVQFVRQLSYGQFGGSAQGEGKVGQEETSDYVRVVVPMAYYSHVRRVTTVANMVDTLDGVKAEERAAADAAKKIAGDIEFDLFRGMDDFTNGGVFDGNPLCIPQLFNMHGVGLQVRQSDSQFNSRDLMFAEYGSDQSVCLSAGGPLTQEIVEDASVRSANNWGNPDKLVVDTTVLSGYNKLTYGKERIILAGSPQNATGGDLRKQWVSGGTVDIEASHFLRGKVRAQAPRANGPAAPIGVAVASVTVAATPTAFAAGQAFWYGASTVNEVGESPVTWAPAAVPVAVAADTMQATITHPAAGTIRYFNVYRSPVGGTTASAKFVGRIMAVAGVGPTIFIDLGNKLPGFVTGYMIEKDTMEKHQLCPYSRLKLAVTELAQPEAYFEFCSLAVTQPRKNVLVDNLT